MKRSDITPLECDSYYQAYLDQISNETSLIGGYINGRALVNTFFNKIPEEKLLYRYKPEKWTIKEILQHLIDAERVFLHRCFRIARHDAKALSGFDQNEYIEPSQANSKSMEDLLDEFNALRDNNIVMLRSFNYEDLKFVGNANGAPLSARAVAFINLGHYIWHKNVIENRYL